MAVSVCKSLWSWILESSPKFTKPLATLKHYVPDEAIFKQGSFSLFLFSLKQILGSERKRLNRHLVLVIISYYITNLLIFSVEFIDKMKTWLKGAEPKHDFA